MDCRQLEVFLKVVELKSFSRAAEALGLTQPTVSGHVLALEEELDLKLLDRLGREVAPTRAGRILHGYASKILRLRDEAYQAMDQFKGDLRGRLEVAASSIPGTYILPPHLKAFSTRYPELTVAVSIRDSQAVAQEVLERQVEIGVVGAKPTTPKLTGEPLTRDELVLVIPPGHSWDGREAVEFKELAGQPFLMREVGSGTRKRFEQALHAAGLSVAELTQKAELETNEAIKQAVASSLGVAVISDLAVAEEIEHGSLRALPLRGASLQRTFYIIRRRGANLSPASEAFLAFLRQEVTEPDLSEA
jgi:DNA-binding transcriptional LysR family regulator